MMVKVRNRVEELHSCSGGPPSSDPWDGSQDHLACTSGAGWGGGARVEGWSPISPPAFPLLIYDTATLLRPPAAGPGSCMQQVSAGGLENDGSCATPVAGPALEPARARHLLQAARLGGAGKEDQRPTRGRPAVVPLPVRGHHAPSLQRLLPRDVGQHQDPVLWRVQETRVGRGGRKAPCAGSRVHRGPASGRRPAAKATSRAMPLEGSSGIAPGASQSPTHAAHHGSEDADGALQHGGAGAAPDGDEAQRGVGRHGAVDVAPARRVGRVVRPRQGHILHLPALGQGGGMPLRRGEAGQGYREGE